ncbi:MAG TPA: hypothetical protein GX525_10085 [Bacilli bacterium]|nr:hypothetical protein [Bacilli bacterium]
MKKLIMMLGCALLATIGVVSESVHADGDYDERVIISGYGEVTVVDPAVPEVVASIPVNGPVRDMSFTEDGRKGVVGANNRQTLYIIDTVENKVIDTIDVAGRTEHGYLDRRVFGAAISPDGTKVYAFVTQGEKRTNIFKALPNQILEFDLNTKEIVRQIEAPNGVHALAFKKDDPSTLFVWNYDLYKLDLDKWKIDLVHGIKNPADENEGSGNFLLLFPRGENGFNSFPIFREYPDGTVTEGILWFNYETEEVKSIEYDEEPVGMFSAIIERDESYAYTVLNQLYKVDLKTGEIVKRSKPPTGSTYGINMSLDEERIYLAGAGNDFTVANKEFEVLHQLKLPTDGLDLKVIAIKK